MVDAAPGRVLLAQSLLYPGGGGQLADRGMLRWARGEHAVTGFETAGGKTWILLDDPAAEPSGPVEAVIDAGFRQMMRELHTDTSSFARALRPGMRQDPDVVLVGEIGRLRVFRCHLHSLSDR